MNSRATSSYEDVKLFIAGGWTAGTEERYAVVENPATEEPIGRVAFAGSADLERAVQAARNGFSAWRTVSAYDRYRLMRRAADIFRSKIEKVAVLMTMEQGKPLSESRAEATNAGDIIDWFAEEGRRAYGLVIPSRASNVHQSVVKEPVGPIAAFTPWNFPINQAVRKISQAVAAGCSIVIKGPEETPASCAALVAAFAEAGLPAGVVNLVFGGPAEISKFLIAHPAIRKVSFTGSTAVGKQLASMSGAHMKRITMELGGHAPAIVFDDADVDVAVTRLVASKFRNAGQICVSPTRFLVQRAIYEEFVSKFVKATEAIVVGDGFGAATQMGPLVSQRRLRAVEQMLEDAVSRGATVRTGGRRFERKGYFFSPTVLTEVPKDARIMNEEPFGPLVPIHSFDDYEEAIEEANRLPYGLAAFVYTRSPARISGVSSDIESGMIAINHHVLGLPELPFGGVKESGYGTEGGPSALDYCLVSKLVTYSDT